MDRAGVSRAVFVGLSMGGYVAFRIQELASHRVAGLVLADTRAGPDDEAGRARRTEQARRVRTEGLDWLPDALVPALLGETSLAKRPEVVENVRSWITQEAHPEGVARALEAMRDRPDSLPDLSGIQVPVLVLVGEEDTLTPPSEARRMADAIPGARLEILSEGGHLSNLETPEAFNRALRSFVG
jgi:3-oxoadipate enol-lactonase